MSVVEIFPRAKADRSRREGTDEHYGALVVILSGSVVERFEITRPRMYIGRGVHADLRLNSQYVSVNHAMVSIEVSRPYIIDLHSKNKTLVNGRAESKKALVHGDIVMVGEFTLRYEAPQSLPAVNSAKDADEENTGTSPALSADPATTPSNGNHSGEATARTTEGEQSDAPTMIVPRFIVEQIENGPAKPTPAAAATAEAPEAPEAATATSALAAPSATTISDGTAESLPAVLGESSLGDAPIDEMTCTVTALEDAARDDTASENTSPGDGTLDDAALVVAIAEAARDGRTPLDVLEETSGLDASALAAELARVFAYPHLAGRDLMRLQANFELLPAAEARRRGCLVLHAESGLTAVIADPFDNGLRPWLESRVPSPLKWALAARGDVNAYISKHEQSLRAIDSALEGAHGELTKDGEIEELSMASINRDSSPVVKLVRSTLYDALRANASDVHLEAGNARLEIRYRLDGVLVPVATVPGTEITEQVISRIKVMSELDIAERRVPQDGRFKSSFDGRAIDFRVSIMPSAYGEDAVLRVLDKQAITDQMSELRIDGLGFDAGIVDSLRHLSSLPHGMLLVTGPTGSGKTTTLYAAISETNTGMEKIVTIEDPVEYQLPGVLQIPVNEKKGLTFARGLRSILRHDPDKIMVGEIRDPETAQIAVQSALTGHLVFTTVHANNVFDVLSRFTHMGVDVYSFTAALNGILAQRLVRIICDVCSDRIVPTADMLAASGLPVEEARAFDWHVGRGCSHCRGTGYRGRRAVGELLVLNDELREAIVARVPVRQLKELAHKNEVRLIRNVALDLAREGLTTMEEVNRVTAVS